MKKADFKHRKLPGSLETLPRFGISPSRPSTRDQADRSDRDIAFGIRSLEDLDKALGRGFAKTERSTMPKKA